MKGLILATVSAIALGLGGVGTAHAWSYSGSTTDPQAQTYYPDFSSHTGAVYRPSGVVVRAQLALRRGGLYHGNIDGILGPATSKALEGFQQQHGLPVTGSLNRVTLASLFGIIPSRYTGVAYRTHAQIIEAQLALRRDGLYHGNIDGILGPGTREALGEYQSRHGLPITDSLSTATMASLGIGPVYQGSSYPGATMPPGLGR